MRISTAGIVIFGIFLEKIQRHYSDIWYGCCQSWEFQLLELSSLKYFPEYKLQLLNLLSQNESSHYLISKDKIYSRFLITNILFLYVSHKWDSMTLIVTFETNNVFRIFHTIDLSKWKKLEEIPLKKGGGVLNWILVIQENVNSWNKTLFIWFIFQYNTEWHSPLVRQINFFSICLN